MEREENENGFGQKASYEPNIQLEASRYLSFFSLVAAATAAAAHIPRSSGKYVPKIEPHEGKKKKLYLRIYTHLLQWRRHHLYMYVYTLNVYTYFNTTVMLTTTFWIDI